MESVGGTAGKARRCPLHQVCSRFLSTLAGHHKPVIDGDDFARHYLAPDHNHCFCAECEPSLPDVLAGGTYEVPKGWCGFGLKLRPGVDALGFWSWPVSFHGCKAANVPSILSHGSLLMPGDQMMDGTTLKNAHTGGGRSRLHIYTSPSVLYSELDIYCEPISFEGHNVRLVLQCRQNPTALSTCGETIGWKRRFGDVAISPFFGNGAIEFMTDARQSVIPYRILIKLNSDTRFYQELRLRAFDELSEGDRCRVVADASISELFRDASKQQFLGRVGVVQQADLRALRVEFPGLSETSTFERGQVDAADHLQATCVGQQLRVVNDRSLVNDACAACGVAVTEKMARYCGQSGEVARIGDRSIELLFADGRTYSWGLEALEAHPRPSGQLLRRQVAAHRGPEPAVWEFQDGSRWVKFDVAAAAAVEDAAARGKGTAEARFDNSRGQSVLYRYDLVKLRQINTGSNFQRKIRRSPPVDPVWEFQESDGTWQQFDAGAASAVEDALQAEPAQRSATMDFRNPRSKRITTYRYDLKECVQINTLSGFRRAIRRRPAYDAAVFSGGDNTEEEGGGGRGGRRGMYNMS